jgi:hypothetical protein
MRKINKGSSKVYVPDIINGLTEEVAKVRKAYIKIKPNVVALQVSEGELEGLRRYINGEKLEHFLSNYEEIYARKLAEYGEVKVPPPCYEEALRICHENEIPAEAIDMDDMLFADVFCDSVSSWDLIRHSLRVKKLKRMRFRAESAREFIMEWDREINKLKGFKNLESKREDHMARRITTLTGQYKRILCIMELQRAEGVCAKVLELDNPSR